MLLHYDLMPRTLLENRFAIACPHTVFIVIWQAAIAHWDTKGPLPFTLGETWETTGNLAAASTAITWHLLLTHCWETKTSRCSGGEMWKFYALTFLFYWHFFLTFFFVDIFGCYLFVFLFLKVFPDVPYQQGRDRAHWPGTASPNDLF